MNNLKSLKQLFENKIFRIPDYQRGYSWTEMQLKEFWNDLISMLSGKDHYTGMISLKRITQEDMNKDPKKWNEESWIFDSWGYEGFEIVDGQQRLTTIIVLINEIINYYYSNSLEDVEDINIDGLPISEIKKEFIVISKDRSSIIKTFRFGYEYDDPSDKYFKHIILGEPNGGKIDETYYTLNLYNAKMFFKQQIENLVKNGSIHDLEKIYKKITQKLKFNIYYIENDFNVYMAFETMNNRGKKLSYLELLKNRLIYLSTIFNRPEDEKEKVRNNISDTWKNIYGYLGKDKTHPLLDDEFLQNHWMIYFGFQTRRILDDLDNKKWKTIPYNFFLLNVYFLQQNIHSNNLNLIKTISYNEILNDTELEIEDENQEDIQKNDNCTNKYVLTLEKINDYVNSLNELIQYWYEMHFPNNIKNKDIKKYLERLNLIGFVNSKPLVTVLLSKNTINCDDKIRI